MATRSTKNAKRTQFCFAPSAAKAESCSRCPAPPACFPELKISKQPDQNAFDIMIRRQPSALTTLGLSMAKHMLFLVCFGGMLAFSACSRNAMIDDVAVPPPQDCGYKVIAVDGAPEERIKGTIVTYVPFVTLAEGEHELTIQKKNSESQNHLIGRVRVESGRRYRMRVDAGRIFLEEEIK